MKRGQYWWKRNLAAKKEIRFLEKAYTDSACHVWRLEGLLLQYSNKIESAVEEALKIQKRVSSVSVDLPAHLVLDIRKAVQARFNAECVEGMQ